jgi:hypothetical protein
MTKKFGRSSVLAHPSMVWEESTDLCESSQVEEADREARLRGPDTSADSSHSTRPLSARFSTLLPVVPTFAGTGPTFPRIALETVTMVRSDLSKVVTDQKHDEQFFHEGSHV